MVLYSLLEHAHQLPFAKSCRAWYLERHDAGMSDIHWQQVCEKKDGTQGVYPLTSIIILTHHIIPSF